MKHLDGYAGSENAVIADFLIRLGGTNPAGYPNYRLVESERVLEKIGGKWHDWDENLSIEERSETVRKVIPVIEKVTVAGKEVEVVVEKALLLPGNKPMRVVDEVREIPKYSHLDMPGWVLEKWYPAYLYGSQEDWYSHVIEGTTIPRLGPYPEDGRYEMITGPFPQLPSLSFLEQFVSYHRKRVRQALERDVRSYVNEARHRHEEAEKKRNEDLHKRILDKMSPLTSTSLEAGRWRNEMALKAGITSHMGN